MAEDIVPRYSVSRKRNEPETYEFVKSNLGIIYGMILGDSGIVRRLNSYYMSTTHCEEQMEYLIHKHSLIGSISNTPKITRGDGWSHWYFTTKCHDAWMDLKEEFYHKDKFRVMGKYKVRRKRVTEEILSRVNDHGVAIWIMDDGNLNSQLVYHGKTWSEAMTLSTESFLKEENEMILDWFFRKYGAQGFLCKVHGGNFRIGFNRKPLEKILERVIPYVHKSMTFKFTLKSPHREMKSPEFGSRLLK